MRTVCEIIKETIQNVEDKDLVIKNLNEIKERTDRMEARLLKYCNAIEDLGFKRIGRDYNKQ